MGVILTCHMFCCLCHSWCHHACLLHSSACHVLFHWPVPACLIYSVYIPPVPLHLPTWAAILPTRCAHTPQLSPPPAHIPHSVPFVPTITFCALPFTWPHCTHSHATFTFSSVPDHNYIYFHLSHSVPFLFPHSFIPHYIPFYVPSIVPPSTPSPFTPLHHKHLPPSTLPAPDHFHLLPFVCTFTITTIFWLYIVPPGLTCTCTCLYHATAFLGAICVPPIAIHFLPFCAALYAAND